MTGERRGSSSSNPASISPELQKIEDEYRNKLKKDRERLDVLQKKARPMMKTVRASRRRVFNTRRVVDELTQEGNTLSAEIDQKREKLRLDHKSITEEINREKSKYKKDLATHLQKIKEAEEASKKRQAQLDEIKEKIETLKQTLKNQESEVENLQTRLDQTITDLAAQKAMVEQYSKDLNKVEINHYNKVGAEIKTLSERFTKTRWERAQKIYVFRFEQYRSNVDNARQKTRSDVVQMIEAEHENEDVSDEQLEIEQLLEILKVEMDFFESLVDRAKDIALLDPYISHAFLEVAKIEYLNHDNLYEANMVSEELKDNFYRNIFSDKHCGSEERHDNRTALDIRLTFLDSMVEGRRSTTTSLDSEAERVNADYVKYLQGFKSPNDLSDVAQALRAYRGYWDSSSGEHLAYREETYRKFRDEWEYNISCEVNYIKFSTHDPVKSYAFDLAKTFSKFPTSVNKPRDKRSKDDIAIATIDKQIETLKEYLHDYYNNVLLFDKTPYFKALKEREEQLGKIVKKLNELEKGEELPPADPMISSQYVKGDVIEEHVRACFTYGRDYVDKKDYPINCAWAEEIMETMKDNINTGFSMPNEEPFLNTGKACNDAWLNTMKEYNKMRRDFLHKIPDAMDAALKERNENDKLIEKKMETYVNSLVNKSVN